MTTVLKELENFIMFLVVNFTVTRAPESFRANFDRGILESKLLYGQFNCFATQNDKIRLH